MVNTALLSGSGMAICIRPRSMATTTDKTCKGQPAKITRGIDIILFSCTHEQRLAVLVVFAREVYRSPVCQGECSEVHSMCQR
jgi:hypothetical protein